MIEPLISYRSYFMDHFPPMLVSFDQKYWSILTISSVSHQVSSKEKFYLSNLVFFQVHDDTYIYIHKLPRISEVFICNEF